MASGSEPTPPSNSFRRWWKVMVWTFWPTIALLAWLAVNYDRVRQNLSVFQADIKYFREWVASGPKAAPTKDVRVASAPASPVRETSPITTQSIPTAPTKPSGPSCVSQTAGDILEALVQAKGAHQRKFEKDYAERRLCSAGWHATVHETAKAANGGTWVKAKSPSGPWIVAETVAPTEVQVGDIVQVRGNVTAYQRSGLLTWGALGVTNARVVRRR